MHLEDDKVARETYEHMHAENVALLSSVLRGGDVDIGRLVRRVAARANVGAVKAMVVPLPDAVVSDNSAKNIDGALVDKGHVVRHVVYPNLEYRNTLDEDDRAVVVTGRDPIGVLGRECDAARRIIGMLACWKARAFALWTFATIGDGNTGFQNDPPPFAVPLIGRFTMKVAMLMGLVARRSGSTAMRTIEANVRALFEYAAAAATLGSARVDIGVPSRFLTEAVTIPNSPINAEDIQWFVEHVGQVCRTEGYIMYFPPSGSVTGGEDITRRLFNIGGVAAFAISGPTIISWYRGKGMHRVVREVYASPVFTYHPLLTPDMDCIHTNKEAYDKTFMDTLSALKAVRRQ